jgi:hypothetical protein
MPWHNHAWYFYFKNLLQRFWFWIFLLAASLAFPLLTTDARQKKLYLASLIYCVSFLFMISLSPVKLEFYDAQVYPIFSLIIGLTLNAIYRVVKVNTSVFFSYVFVTLLAGVSVFLFARIIKINSNPVLFPQEVEGAFVKQVFRGLQPRRSKVLLTYEHQEHYDQLNFYRKRYAVEFASKIEIITSAKDVLPNDTVFVCQQSNKDSLLFLNYVDTIQRDDTCLLVRILCKKKF